MIITNNSKLGNIWYIKESSVDTLEAIQNTYKCSLLTAKYIANKNVQFDKIANFLNPTLKNNWVNTNTIPNINYAQECIVHSIKNNEKVGIIGDYDVDGICSSILFKEFFKEFKIFPTVWIPNRNDGYGPGEASLKFFSENPVDLLILVDCGTTAHKFHEQYKKKTLIIDHHHSLNPIKKYLVNPNSTQEFVPQELKELCATSLSFFVISHILKQLNYPNYQLLMKSFLDLVALATVCDMMPINNVNRALIKAGINAMQKQERTGLRQLINFAKIKLPITTKDIGFSIGPRLNATGRIESPKIALNLLQSTSFEECTLIITKMEMINNYRKKIQNDAFKEACEIAQKDNNKILCLASTKWNTGIVGIVAAMIQSEENKSTIVGNINGQYVKASARSNSINIGLLIQKAVELGILESGGGHKSAAGLTCKTENWETFKIWINNQPISINKNIIEIESFSTLSNIDSDYKKLAPFGPYNEEPIILVKNLHISKIIEREYYFQIIVEEFFKTFSVFLNISNIKLIKELKIIHSKKITFSGIFSLQEKGGFLLKDINY